MTASPERASEPQPTLTEAALSTPAAGPRDESGTASNAASPSAAHVDILPHIERVYRSSECRTPLVVIADDGDALPSVTALAKQRGCTVWAIAMDSPKNEQNAVDYLDVGVKNGDWVYLTNVEQASDGVLRQIGLFLYGLSPDPKNYPRRELFRLWVVVEKPFNVNDTIHLRLPFALRQNALISRAAVGGGSQRPSSPQKLVKHLPEDPPLLEQEKKKHTHRKDAGRDSDSESDADEPEKKVTGMWFHRCVDFFSADAGSTLTRAVEMIFPAVENEDVLAIEEACGSGAFEVDKLLQHGMNPLMTAVSKEKTRSVKALLKAGANPEVKRASDGCPLLFMAIEDEAIFVALVEAGADYHERFEGYRLEEHPFTAPHIAFRVRQLKGLPTK